MVENCCLPSGKNNSRACEVGGVLGGRGGGGGGSKESGTEELLLEEVGTTHQ